MKKIIVAFIILIFAAGSYSQQLPVMKIGNNTNSIKSFDGMKRLNTAEDIPQVKKRKAVNIYFGAGYSFLIFTNSIMNTAFPVFDTRNASFLTDINLFFGFAVAKAVTLEIEPSILFTRNTKQVDYHLTSPRFGYDYAHTSSNGLLALPIVVNARFFPAFKSKGFFRLFFVGAGGGMAWIRESNDVYYNEDPYTYYNWQSGGSAFRSGETTSQWAPVGRALIGFTGSGGMFGFGGELRYNFIPLKQDQTLPFATRNSADFNSVDLSLRFYFGM